MVREGYWYGLPWVLLGGGLLGLGFYVLGAAALVVGGLVLNFFRDPERLIPPEEETLVSPADGRVMAVVEEEFNGRRWQRVSIFMSPWDVHVNRAPLAGAVSALEYRRGRFRIARHPEASLENEQNIVTIRGERTTVIVKQIAGVLARRIVFWKCVGDSLKKGERLGLIKFGSRVDVMLEQEIEICARVGDHIRAGSSVLAIVR